MIHRAGTTGYVSDDTCHWLSTQRLTFIDPGKRSRIVEMTRDDGLAIARKQVAVQSLIAAFRMAGTRKAKLDPLLWTSPHAPVELTPPFHGLSAADMSTRFSTADTFLFDEDATLRDIVTALEETYCGTLGAEFDGKDGGHLSAGDVKHHKGFSRVTQTGDGPVDVVLAFNPSHLEFVNPVVQGIARAKGEALGVCVSR